MTDGVVAPDAESWVPVDADSDFPLPNLPFGIFVRPDSGQARAGVAIGNRILDLDVIHEAGLLDGHADLPWAVFAQRSLNQFMSLGAGTWRAVRMRIAELLEAGNRDIRDRWGLAERALVPMPEAQMLLPFVVGDFVSFYSSPEHATNVGRMLRPDAAPLPPNWRHFPIGYHGRSGTVVVSGTPILRPWGQRKGAEGRPTLAPTEALDFEIQVGFVVGVDTPHGRPVTVAEAEEVVFGVVLVNDWSARDFQTWEDRPLGPLSGKSFATSISPWVVTLDALRPFRVRQPAPDPVPLEYLAVAHDSGLDMELEAAVASEAMAEGGEPPTVVTQTNSRTMYWTLPQHLAQATVNGASVRTGDLFASGTVSGAEPGTYGSMLELTSRADRPLVLGDGSERRFIEDGDSVVIRGWCEGAEGRPRVGFGEVTGRVLPALRHLAADS